MPGRSFDFSQAYSVHGEADACHVDALSDMVVVRLRQIDSEGCLIREMLLEMGPDAARAFADGIRAKADLAETMAGRGKPNP